MALSGVATAVDPARVLPCLANGDDGGTLRSAAAEQPTIALAESFFSTLKNELGDGRPQPTRAAARTAIFEWIESRYSLQRLHSRLGYRSLADYESILAAA